MCMVYMSRALTSRRLGPPCWTIVYMCTMYMNKRTYLEADVVDQQQPVVGGRQQRQGRRNPAASLVSIQMQ